MCMFTTSHQVVQNIRHLCQDSEGRVHIWTTVAGQETTQKAAGGAFAHYLGMFPQWQGPCYPVTIHDQRNQQAKELRLWSFQVVSFLYLPRAFQWVKASCFVKTPWKTMLLGVNAIFTLLDTILDRILYHLVSQFCECHMPKAMRAWTPRGVLWDLLSRGSVVASLHLTRFTQANVTVQDAMLSQGAKALLNCAMTWTFRHCETLPATRSGTTWDHWKLKSSVKRAQSNGSRVLLSWIQCARQQSPGSPVHSDLVA